MLLGLVCLGTIKGESWIQFAMVVCLMAGLIRGDDRVRIVLIIVAGLGAAFSLLGLLLTCLAYTNGAVPLGGLIWFIASLLFSAAACAGVVWVLLQPDVRAWMVETTAELPQRKVADEGPYRSLHVPASRPREERARSPQAFTPLEDAVFEALLEGDHEILATLRAQRALAKVADRRRTVRSFVLTLELPAAAIPVAGEPQLRIDDVVARIDGREHRFVLLVRNGRLASLESVARDTPWPEDTDHFVVDYVEPPGPDGVQRRWISQVQPRS